MTDRQPSQSPYDSEREEPVRLDGSRVDAVLFDLDGVLTDSARAHERAWEAVLNAFLQQRSKRDNSPFVPFTHEDYLTLVDGRSREDGIRAFLAARGIPLPDRAASDDDGLSVAGLAERKTALFLADIRRNGVDVDPAAGPLLKALRKAGIKTGLVTSSRNAAEVVAAAGLEGAFDATVDGNVGQALSLPGKPAPDAFLEAARRLGTSPERTAVVEDALAGVQAGYDGGFALVVGVGSGDRVAALREAGADAVVASLSLLDASAPRVAGATEPAGLLKLNPFADRPAAAGRLLGGTEEASDWLFRCESFDPASEGRRETLFALGNGRFVTRGSAAEAKADGIHYPGTYLAGGYNRLVSMIDGRPIEHEDLVNLPNWLPFSFRAADGEWLHLGRHELVEAHQVLDLREGLYHRSIRVRDAAGRITRMDERRLVSMADRHLAGQHIELIAENWSGALTLRAGIDGDVSNAGVLRYRPYDGRHLTDLVPDQPDFETLTLDAETSRSQLAVSLAARIRLSVNGEPHRAAHVSRLEAASAMQESSLMIIEGDRVELEKVVALVSSRDRAIADTRTTARKAVEHAGPFDALLADHALAWEHLWRRCDLVIEMNHEAPTRRTQLAIRLHIFHLLQTASPLTAEVDAGIPARGWHGEGYRGHIFWDELFIFPFLSLRLPNLARALLLYRYRRLGEARRAAQEAGYAGGMFPWQSGSDGREETDTMFLNPRSGRWIEDNSHLQRHVGAAIAYTVWHYWQASGDEAFLSRYGAELLLEIARFWASAARWNEHRGRFELEGMMGPDEFHDRYPGRETPGLDNNAYTNAMAAWCLHRALEVLELVPEERRKELCECLRLEPEELARWDEVGRRLHLPIDAAGMLLQFEGYEGLEEFDWSGYRDRYGNIMRLDLILEAEQEDIRRFKLSKQADVLMLFYLFSAEELAELFGRLGYRFDPAVIPRTIDYYLERTSHGSTLCAVVHAWVLARACRQRSWTLFEQALRSDIDDIQGGTTAEGIHLGAMAGTVDLLQRCYTGLELREGRLIFNPTLPEALSRLAFRLRLRGQMLSVELTRTRITVTSEAGGGAALPLVLAGTAIDLEAGSSVSAPLSGSRDGG